MSQTVLVDGPTSGVLVLKLNRPKTKNAFNGELVTTLTELLRSSKDDEHVKVLVLSGTGDLFSSGADLQDSPAAEDPDMPYRGSPVGILMWEFIHYPKPIVVAVNGGAVGMGVTLLLHCDIVYAVKDAYFFTPFARNALAPEFASSLLLPEIVGPSLSNEMLLAGKRVTAQEAHHHKLVSAVYDTKEACLQAAVDIAKQMSSFPLAEKSLPLFKSMIRNPSRLKDIVSVYNMEGDVLDTRRKNGESAAAILQFLSQKKGPDSKL